ncbi:Ribonuclease HI [Bienertia sinuspersici]
MYTYCHLVTAQMRGEFETREPGMVRYKQKVKELAGKLEKFDIALLPRKDNSEADALAMLASSMTREMKGTIMMENT